MDIREIECKDINWIYLTGYNLMGGFCEHGDDILGTIKGRGFVDQLSLIRLM